MTSSPDATGRDADDPDPAVPNVSVPDAAVPETAVPSSAEPAARCPYCDRPFATSHRKRLHLGEAHDEQLGSKEREAYEAALETERDELFTYQLRVVVALGITYTIMVLILMVILGGGP